MLHFVLNSFLAFIFLSKINLNMHASIHDHGTIGQTTNIVEKSHIMMLITHINLHMYIVVLLE